MCMSLPVLEHCSPPLENEWEASIAMQTLEKFLAENQEPASSLGFQDVDISSDGTYIPQNVHYQTLGSLQPGMNSSHQYILSQPATEPSNDGIYILTTSKVDTATVCTKENDQFSLPVLWSQSSQYFSDGLGSDSAAETWLGSLPSDLGRLDQGDEHRGRLYASGMGCELKSTHCGYC
jgi:hypothetical protein